MCLLEGLYLIPSFSSQNLSSFMVSKTLQIHCYYQISQEQSSSKVTFQVLIWNEIVRYQWRENGHFSWSAYFSNSMGKIWLLWVFRLLENAFTTIVDLKMLSDTDGHRKPQPKSPYVFMQIFLSIILLTLNSISSKIAFPWSHLHLELFQNFLL